MNNLYLYCRKLFQARILSLAQMFFTAITLYFMKVSHVKNFGLYGHLGLIISFSSNNSYQRVFAVMSSWQWYIRTKILNYKSSSNKSLKLQIKLVTLLMRFMKVFETYNIINICINLLFFHDKQFSPSKLNINL